MQLTPSTSLVESAGLGEENDFKIRASAQAFKILSSGLYSDKISAVLREIGCNAVDAHTAAGTPELPFEVKLPSYLDPEFYIKDWGPGLSPDEVTEIYTTYFASTKATSNTMIGAFGLGSKSPFAYIDQFTLTVAQHGRVRNYAAFINAAGAPTITLVSEDEAPADWQHGLRVSLPVRAGDIWEFEQKAQEVFQWFAVPPRVIGSKQIEPPTWAVINPMFALPDSSSGNPSIIMGGVRYRYDYNQLMRGIENTPYESFLTDLYLSAGIMFVPIGLCDVTPSRETIEFTTRTRSNLQQHLKDAADTFAGWARDQLNRWDETAATAAEIAKEFETLIKARARLTETLRKLIDTAYPDEAAVLNSRFDVIEHGRNTFSTRWNDTDQLVPMEFFIDSKRHMMRRTRAAVQQGAGLKLATKYALIVNDGVTKRVNDRIRLALEAKQFDACILIPNGPGALQDALVARYKELPLPLPELTFADLPTPAPRPKRDAATPKKPRSKPDDKPIGAISVKTPITSNRAVWENTPQVRIGDLDPASSAYIVRYVGWGKYSAAMSAGGYKQVHQSTLDQFIVNIAEATEQFSDVITPLAYVLIVTEGDIKRFKLHERGFKSMKDYVKPLDDAQVRDALKVANGRFDEVTSSLYGYNSWHAIRQLVYLAAVDAQFWTALRDEVGAHPLIDQIEDIAGRGSEKTNAATEPKRNAYNTLSNYNLVSSPVGSYYTGHRPSLSSAIEPIKAQYPWLTAFNFLNLDTIGDARTRELALQYIGDRLGRATHIQAAA